MKATLFLLAFLVSATSFADIIFDGPKADPIVMKLTGSARYVSDTDIYYNSRLVAMIDGDATYRLVIETRSNRYYYQSSGAKNRTPWLSLTSAEATQLIQLSNIVSEQCPVTISVDRETFELKKVSCPCDPME